MTGWTPERTELLKSMWEAGKKYNEIAIATGMSVRSVKGKKRRLEIGRPDGSIAWDANRDAKLKAMFEAGYSASRMAIEFGDCTKNAVIGRCNRIGLQRKGNGSHAHITVRPRKPRHKPVKRERFKMQIVKDAEPLPPPLVAPNCNPVSFLDLKPHHCRYIPDDPADLRTMYCGAPAVEGTSWCPYHLDIVTKEVAPSRLPFIPMRFAA